MPGAAMGSSAVSPKRVWPVVTVSRLVPEPVDLGEQPGLRGGREAEHRHDRRDADRDAERGQSGAQPPGAHADARDAREVGQGAASWGRAASRRHVCCPGGRLTSANAAAPACLTMALTT